MRNHHWSICLFESLSVGHIYSAREKQKKTQRKDANGLLQKCECLRKVGVGFV